MRTIARSRYAGYRFPAEIISHAVWLYFRFPLGLRLVEELLAARGIVAGHETVRQGARKFGQASANQIRHYREHVTATEFRAARTRAFELWADITGVAAAAQDRPHSTLPDLRSAS